MIIGNIVHADSHVRCVCQIYNRREVERAPSPADYAFGRFVRAVRPSFPQSAARTPGDLSRADERATYVVGVIYDTILVNPQFSALAPVARLSTEEQVEIFSPDLSEKAVMTLILPLGTMEFQRSEQDAGTVSHGIPPCSLDLGSEIETMSDEQIRAFHFFADAGSTAAFLHMGYLPHLIAQPNSLLPMVILRVIDQLERLVPMQSRMLSIIKHNLAWRLKIKSTG